MRESDMGFAWKLALRRTVYRGVIVFPAVSTHSSNLSIVIPTQIDPNSMNPDPAVELNNFLQNHPTGNLTPLFHWAMDREPESQDHNAVHIATAMFRSRPVGQGRGTSKGAAKRDAAEIVLASFRANGVPGASS